MDRRSLLDSELGTEKDFQPAGGRGSPSEYSPQYAPRNHRGGNMLVNNNTTTNRLVQEQQQQHQAISPTSALPSNLLSSASTHSMHHHLNQDASHEHSAIDLFENLKITEDGDIEVSNIYFFGNSPRNNSSSSSKKKKKADNKNGHDDSNSNSDAHTLYSDFQNNNHHHGSSSSNGVRPGGSLTSTARRVPLTEVSKVTISKFSNYGEALWGFIIILCSILVTVLGGYFCEKCSEPGENSFPCNVFRVTSSSNDHNNNISSSTTTFRMQREDTSTNTSADMATKFLHYYSLWMIVSFILILLNFRRIITLIKVVWNFLLPSRVAFYNIKIDFQGTATRPLILSYNNYDSKHLNPVKLCDLICKSRMAAFGLSNLLTFNVVSMMSQQQHHGGGVENNNVTGRITRRGRSGVGNNNNINNAANSSGVTDTGVVYSSGTNSAFSQRLPLSGKILTITSEYIRLESDPSSICCNAAFSATHKNVKMLFLDDVGEISVIKVPLSKGSSADFANFCMFLSVGICVVAGIGVGAGWFKIDDTRSILATSNNNGIVIILVLITSIFVFLVGFFLHTFASRYAVLVNSKTNANSNTYNPLKSMMSSLASSFVVECAIQKSGGSTDCSEAEELEQAENLISVIRTAQRERKRMLSMNYEERRQEYGQYCASGTASVLDESEIASRNAAAMEV